VREILADEGYAVDHLTRPDALGADLAPHGRLAYDLVLHPLLRDKVAAVFEATDVAIVTSGAYERGTHIVDPHTVWLPKGVLSVTVAGPELTAADAYATAACAMGQDDPAWTARLLGRGYEALTILADGTVRTTPGFPLTR